MGCMPKITTIIPAPLAGILFVATLVISLDIDVPSVSVIWLLLKEDCQRFISL